MNIDEQDKEMAEGFGEALALTEEAVAEQREQEPVAMVNGTGVYWLEGLIPHGTLLYAAPVAKAHPAQDAKRLALDAVDHYRRMQRELYSVHHTMEGQTLDTLSKAMQDAFGSPARILEIAVERAAMLTKEPKP